MIPRRRSMLELWPWLLIVAVMALGPVLASCAPAQSAATPTPTKTPRPDVTATATGTELPVMPQPGAAEVTQAPAATDTPAAAATTANAVSATPTAPDSAASVSPTPKPPSSQPVVSPNDMMSAPDYGVQAFLWWREEVADRDLGYIQKAGFHWVKQLFSWQDIEGAGKGKYDWSRTDRIVDQVERAGLKLIVRVSQDPDKPFWGGKPPENGKDFADFLAQMAARYNGRIQAYQIWNEPNLAREWGQKRPDPVGYARMLKLAYNSIKTLDPNALVITAGMAPTGTDSNEAMPDAKFYDLMYQAMQGNSDGYFDMLGVHAAGFAAAPEVSPDEAAGNKARYGGERFFAFRHVEDIRKIMERYGDQKKRVAILEFGWTSDDRPDSPYFWHAAGAGIDEATKGKYLVRGYQWAAQHWTPWIGLMVVIYMPDPDWTRETEQYYWSIIGPSPTDFFVRAAYVELCIYLNKLEGQRCWTDPNP